MTTPELVDAQRATLDLTEATASRTPPAARESLAWISWLRVLAITGVVTIHTLAPTAILSDARSTPVGITAIALNRGFNFSVVIFVLVSGALLLNPAVYPGDGPFLRKRALRLIPAIIFWHLFYWGAREWFLGTTMSPEVALAATLNGRLFTALYFFWIVLGLAVVAPVLVAWLRTASRRAALVAGGLAMLIPILTTATMRFRGAPVVWIETPWTWWVPYLGAFILGWALRGVRLPTWGTWLCVLLPLPIIALIFTYFRRPDAPDWFVALFRGYYSLGVQLGAVMVFLAFQSLVRLDGPLRFAARGRPATFARTVGDATLGIFALHLAVLYISYKLPVIGGSPAAQTFQELIGRLVFVLVVTTALTLLGRRIPVVRRVL